MWVLLLTAWKFEKIFPDETNPPSADTLQLIKNQLDVNLPNTCFTAEDSTFNYTKTRVYSLGVGVELYQVPCNFGAYNTNYAFFVHNKDGLHMQQFALPMEKRLTSEMGSNYVEVLGMTTSKLLTNPIFYPEHKALTELSLGRGMADMFMANRWTFQEGAFILVESWQDVEDDMKQQPQLLYSSPDLPNPVWETVIDE